MSQNITGINGRLLLNLFYRNNVLSSLSCSNSVSLILTKNSDVCCHSAAAPVVLCHNSVASSFSVAFLGTESVMSICYIPEN